MASFAEELSLELYRTGDIGLMAIFLRPVGDFWAIGLLHAEPA